MKVEFPVRFTKKQQQILTSDAYENLIDGNKGGGKTLALVCKIYYDCMKYKKIHWGFFRRTLPEVRETFLKYALENFPKGTYEYKVAQNRVAFPATGSHCSLGAIDNDKDLVKYSGFSFHRVGFDEATKFPPNHVGYIKAQVRSDKKDVKPQIFYCTNPGGISHGFFKERFVDNKEPWVKYETPESAARRKREGWGEGRAVYLMRCQVMLEDNPFLLAADPDYVTRLDELPEDDKPAMRDGSWDILSGQFFKIKKDIHMVSRYTPQPSDHIFISCDWGTSKPFAIGWFAVTKDDHIIMYREYYGLSGKGIANDGCNMTAEEVAYQIIEQTPSEEVVKYMVLDTACWSQDGHGMSIYEIMQNILKTHGIFIVKAHKDRVNGWETMKKYLSIDKYTQTPFLQVTEDCVHFFRTVPYQLFDHKKYNDMRSDREDHISDMCRYMLNSRPVPKRLTQSLEAPMFSLKWVQDQTRIKESRRI